jgi:hypothetical protein
MTRHGGGESSRGSEPVAMTSSTHNWIFRVIGFISHHLSPIPSCLAGSPLSQSVHHSQYS